MSPQPVGWSADVNAARLEDLLWFVETGESLMGAASRLGISPGSLEKWCGRHGRHDIVAKLRARDPFDPNISLSERGRIGAAARWAS